MKKNKKQKNTFLYLVGAASESDRKTCLWIFRSHNTWSVIYRFCAVDIHTYTESFNRHCYMLIASKAQWTVKLPVQHSAQLSDLSCFLPHMLLCSLHSILLAAHCQFGSVCMSCIDCKFFFQQRSFYWRRQLKTSAIAISFTLDNNIISGTIL